MEGFLWAMFFVSIPVIFFIWCRWVYPADENRKCAWCDGTEIKFKNGNEDDWYWQYRNKDGSKDQRVKDNFRQAGYHSEFECEECSATSSFIHYVNKDPSSEVKVWKRTLVTKGNGDRKGQDWVNDNSETIHTDQANRKNK